MNAHEANGATLHYRANLSRPGARTFVFINSLGTDFRIWDGVIENLAGRYNHILHDKRGHGLSTLGNGPVSIRTYADDVASLIGNLGAQNVVLCGISVGGLIAQQVMLQGNPETKAAILSNTGLKIGTDESWNSRIASIASTGLESISDAVLERWFSPAFRHRQPGLLSLYRTMLARSAPEGYVACCKAIRDNAAFNHATTAQPVPALCIGGSLDGSTPPDMVKTLAENVPHSRYIEFEGAGHLPCIEEPERYAKFISEFADAI